MRSFYGNKIISPYFSKHIPKKHLGTDYMKDININEVPYISTYYMPSKIKDGEDLTLNFYATDWNQSEYIRGYYYGFELLYEVDGRLHIKKVISGDNSITIKGLNEGEHLITLQLRDGYGRLSHKLYHELLVINKDYIPNMYEVTDSDLQSFSINKNNSQIDEDLDNTHTGLNNLFMQKSNEGYDGLILPTGIYRIRQIGFLETGVAAGRHDNTYSLKIPSNFTVDLNGSTIKQHVYEGHSSIMVSFYNTFDSHLINGTLEGDYGEHLTTDEDGNSNNGEHCYCVDFQGDCKYCTLDNLVIKNTVGYTTISQSIALATAPGDKTLIQGDIVNGELVDNKLRKSTANFLDISAIKAKSKYLRASIYLGYSGVVSESWIVDFHFYDSEYLYLETIRGFQYRKVLIPENAKYLKITMHDGTIDNIDNLTIYDYAKPVNCSILNTTYENTRTCGIATTQTDNLLIKNVKFINSGQHITPLPIDLEDGWYGTLDTTFDNISMSECPFNSALICSGHNTIFENCNGENMTFTFRGGWNASRGGVIRNCNINQAQVNHGAHKYSAFSRIYDNTLINGVAPSFYTAVYSSACLPLVVKNSTINGFGTSDNCNIVYDNCIFIGENGSGLSSSRMNDIKIINSTIRNYNVKTHEAIWKNLNIKNSTIENISVRLFNALNIENSKISNFDGQLYTGNSDNIEIKNNTIHNSTITSLYYLNTNANIILDNNTIINENSPLLDMHVVALDNVTLIDNSINSIVSPLYIQGYSYGTNLVNFNLNCEHNIFDGTFDYIIDAKTYINLSEGDSINITANNNTVNDKIWIIPILENNQYVHIGTNE